MIVVQDRNKLLNRFKVLLNKGTEVKLYRQLPHASEVTTTKFRGHMSTMNVYRSVVRALEKAKRTKKRDDYVAYIMALKPKATERIQDAAAGFLEAAAIESLAMNKEAIEGSFRKVFGHTASVIVPDKFWHDTAQEAVGALCRFKKAISGIIDISVDDERLEEIVADNGKAMVRRVANEGFLVQSRTARRVQGYAGVTKYVWVTMKDNRVVGNPAGLYPIGTEEHGDHWDRDGKVFEWDEPPHDGHPGESPGCRCLASPLMGLGNAEIR
jgi:hypothetical protein